MAKPLKLVTVPPKSITGVVASAVYAGGRRVPRSPIEEAGEWSRKAGHVVWIGLHEPEPRAPATASRREFGLHDLAIEDAAQGAPAAQARAIWRCACSSSPARPR